MKTANDKPATIDEYISQFPVEVQETLAAIRNSIREVAPDAEEAIKYQIPTFVQGENLVHFAANKKHIGFYPTPSGVSAFQAELSAYDCSKGAIQFPFATPIPLDLIKKIVRFRLAEALEKQAAKKKASRVKG